MYQSLDNKSKYKVSMVHILYLHNPISMPNTLNGPSEHSVYGPKSH